MDTYIPSYLHTCIPAYIPTYLPTYMPTYLPMYVQSAILIFNVHQTWFVYPNFDSVIFSFLIEFKCFFVMFCLFHVVLLCFTVFSYCLQTQCFHVLVHFASSRQPSAHQTLRSFPKVPISSNKTHTSEAAYSIQRVQDIFRYVLINCWFFSKNTPNDVHPCMYMIVTYCNCIYAYVIIIAT